jgi:23S rRNA (uracil1939-C5)-methyltransferase
VRPKKGEIVTLNVTDLAFGGKGVAKIENFVVFIESAVPGDIIEAKIVKSRGNYAEAKIERLITPSEHRVAPACEHFGLCGGCKWQHLEYAIQKKYKEDQVRQALIHIGGIKEPPVEPIIGAHKIY